jgi:hypothetical protein
LTFARVTGRQALTFAGVTGRQALTFAAAAADATLPPVRATSFLVAR